MTTARPTLEEPADWNALVALAQREHLAGRRAEAAAAYRQVLAVRPDIAEVHNNLGTLLWEQGELDQAVAAYRRALALKPDYAESHCNLGSILWRQGKLDEAAAQFEQALAFEPDFAKAHNNLGIILWEQGKLELAAARFEQALALSPNHAATHSNLGNVLLSQGKPGEALPCYLQALALRPDYTEAQNNVAMCYLVLGDFERGWPAYEARLRMPKAKPLPNLPRWTGQPLAGRRLLLLAEQGLGDTFQFLRYARVLKRQGAHVVLAVQAPLGPLLRSHPDVDELVLLGESTLCPRCDFVLPLLSAPGVLGTDVATIPREVPYLWADPDLTAQWRREFSGIEGFKIGIGWQCLRNFSSDRERAIPLAQFAPLARLPGVRLISLQKGFGSEQTATVDFPVIDFAQRLDESAGPFMDTAALIGGLDLVVTSDTAVAHLAGGLGAPVWVALPLAPDWRWLMRREDSPWYPTMRLFRQTAAGQWPEVFERIASAVQTRRAQTA